MHCDYNYDATLRYKWCVTRLPPRTFPWGKPWGVPWLSVVYESSESSGHHNIIALPALPGALGALKIQLYIFAFRDPNSVLLPLYAYFLPLLCIIVYYAHAHV